VQLVVHVFYVTGAGAVIVFGFHLTGQFLLSYSKSELLAIVVAGILCPSGCPNHRIKALKNKSTKGQYYRERTIYNCFSELWLSLVVVWV